MQKLQRGVNHEKHEVHERSKTGRSSKKELMYIARHFAVLLIGLLLAAAPAPVAIAASPKLASGVPAYPPPFLAVARTPYSIAPLAGKAIDIQTDFGYPAGFSGFVDAAVGSVGYPGYRNFSNLDIAYDAEKLCLLFCVPYPVGRKTRANATEPSDALAADDVFEVLIDPRDDQGRSKGPVYRIVVNAGGACKIDRDLPQIGQPHQPWRAAVKCGSMMWDPMGSWMAAVQIPFDDLGGPPQDGDVWGFQAAIRYADPKITAVLSPADDFTAPAAICPRAFRRPAEGQLPLSLAERGRDQAGDLLRRRHLQQRRATSRPGSTDA